MSYDQMIIKSHFFLYQFQVVEKSIPINYLHQKLKKFNSHFLDSNDLRSISHLFLQKIPFQKIKAIFLTFKLEDCLNKIDKSRLVNSQDKKYLFCPICNYCLEDLVSLILCADHNLICLKHCYTNFYESRQREPNIFTPRLIDQIQLPSSQQLLGQQQQQQTYQQTYQQLQHRDQL